MSIAYMIIIFIVTPSTAWLHRKHQLPFKDRIACNKDRYQGRCSRYGWYGGICEDCTLCVTLIADSVSARPQFETLTASTTQRSPFALYEKYLNAVAKFRSRALSALHRFRRPIRDHLSADEAEALEFVTW